MQTITQKRMTGLTLAVLREMAGVAGAGLTANTQIALAGSSAGRITLHLLCAWGDHRLQWHWQGVVREFAEVGSL